MRILLIFLITPAFFFAQTAEKSERLDSLCKRLNYAFDNPLRTRLDSLVHESAHSYMQTPRNCGLSIAVKQGTETVFYNYGETKRNTGLLPFSGSVYEIGAMTNVFVGYLFSKAVKEKKLSYEDDVRKYLPGNYPGLVFREAPIKLKHLLHHRSGLPNIPTNLLGGNNYDSLNPYQHYSKQMILDYLKTIQLKKEPGKTFEYSALGMALAGMALENVEGKSFAELIKESTDPELRNTRLNREDTDVRGYDDAGKETASWDMGDWVAAGGLRSSTGDLINLANVSNPEENESWFRKKTKQGNDLFWCNGGTFGFSGFIGVIKKRAESNRERVDRADVSNPAAVIILSNSAMNVDYIAIALLNYLQE